MQHGQPIIKRNCKTSTRPEATCGAESWELDKDIAKWLVAFETKV
jgi:hypothetical protein